jgi:ribosomal protein S18 acetylase RimI-like enzyme
VALTRLRAVNASDREFLIDLYASVREPELELVPWDPGIKWAFVEHQFAAQDRHYRTHYDGATLDVVEVAGEPVGRLYVHRAPSEIRIMDIALLPEFRGRGIGERLLRSVLHEADDAAIPVSIHVERGNRAMSLYKRLGFFPVEERGPYVLMRRLPLS